jgi:hypothetical protein
MPDTKGLPRKKAIALVRAWLEQNPTPRQTLNEHGQRREELLDSIGWGDEWDDETGWWKAPEGLSRALTVRELGAIQKIASTHLDVRASADNGWTDGDPAEENRQLGALVREVRGADLDQPQAVQHAIERWARSVLGATLIGARSLAAKMLEVSWAGVSVDREAERQRQRRLRKNARAWRRAQAKRSADRDATYANLAAYAAGGAL